MYCSHMGRVIWIVLNAALCVPCEFNNQIKGKNTFIWTWHSQRVATSCSHLACQVDTVGQLLSPLILEAVYSETFTLCQLVHVYLSVCKADECGCYMQRPLPITNSLIRLILQRTCNKAAQHRQNKISGEGKCKVITTPIAKLKSPQLWLHVSLLWKSREIDR